MRLRQPLSTNDHIQPIIISLVLSFVMAQTSLIAWADGGALRLRQKAGGYDIAVFTSPTPIRAGTVDVSVLVQDAATQEFVPDTKVTVCPKVPGTERILRYAATNEAATNKLFKAAVFKIPAAGLWDLQVAVKGPHGLAQVAFTVNADDRLPHWREFWPWFAWPALVIALFGAHQVLARRVSRRGPIRSRISSLDRELAMRKGFKQGEMQ
jgi:hypothetical protein